MHRISIIRVCFFSLLVVSFISGGCGIFGSVEEEKPASELMEEGMEHFNNGYYTKASESFKKLRDRYPYSELAVKAELMIADSLYKTEKYQAAFDAYDEFERLHPKHKEIPYVIYQKGMCHFSQVSTIDREQSHTKSAKDEFERLVKRFPRSEYAGKARKKIRKCYINMAEYELYVGHYYFDRGNYRAAIGRYEYLIKNYPDMGQYYEALEYLNKAKQRLAEKEEEQEKNK